MYNVPSRYTVLIQEDKDNIPDFLLKNPATAYALKHLQGKVASVFDKRNITVDINVDISKVLILFITKLYLRNYDIRGLAYFKCFSIYQQATIVNLSREHWSTLRVG